MSNTNIAQTILNQIGRKALYMIGAKQYVAIENGVRFRIMKNKSGANMIRITLNAMDTYDIEFLSIRGMSVKTKATLEGYYVDMIHKGIETTTGLYLSL